MLSQTLVLIFAMWVQKKHEFFDSLKYRVNCAMTNNYEDRKSFITPDWLNIPCYTDKYFWN